MTTTSTPAPPAAAPRPSGLVGWLAATDHKRIGIMTAVTALVFFAVSGTLALLIRTELASPGMQVVSHDTYNQLFTLHGSGMIFLVMTPAALALGVYIVPLQVGAAEIMAPRLALAAPWLLVLGGLSMFLGFATGQGAGKAGWSSYYPLSGEQGTPGTGMDMWIIGVMLATAGGTLLGVCIVGTILRLRAPGMTMLRMPVFTWTMLVSSLMVVLSFPVLIGAFALLLSARHGGARGLRRRRRSDRLPEPVLVLRPPGGLRHVLPVPGGGARGDRDLLGAPHVRLPALRRLDPRLRRACR